MTMIIIWKNNERLKKYKELTGNRRRIKYVFLSSYLCDKVGGGREQPRYLREFKINMKLR